MDISPRKLLRFLTRFAALLVLVLGQAVYAADQAGQVESVKGKAWAQLPEQAARVLEEGSVFYTLDTIRTESDSTIQLTFNDQTRFSLGADTEMNIEKFNDQGAVEEKGLSVRVLKGTFRFITGLIAREKPEAMEVNTAVATIGIRGTHVVAEATATSAIIILMEPEDTTRKTAIEVSNQYGKVSIDEPGYGTEIPDQYSPPSPPRRMRLETINNIMRNMQSIQRMNIPRPRMP